MLCVVPKPYTDELTPTLIVEFVPVLIIGVAITLNIGIVLTFTVDIPTAIDTSPSVDAALVATIRGI